MANKKIPRPVRDAPINRCEIPPPPRRIPDSIRDIPFPNCEIPAIIWKVIFFRWETPKITPQTPSVVRDFPMHSRDIPNAYWDLPNSEKHVPRASWDTVTMLEFHYFALTVSELRENEATGSVWRINPVGSWAAKKKVTKGSPHPAAEQWPQHPARKTCGGFATGCGDPLITSAAIAARRHRKITLPKLLYGVA